MADITIRISDRALKIAAGVLVAVFVLWGFAQLRASGVLRPKYQLQMFLPNDGGLRAGALVTLNGLRVGSVSKVEPADAATDSNRTIKVTLSIQRDVRDMVRTDSKASLLQYGLLGERYVNIHRGFAGSPIEPGGEISVVPTKEASLTDFINALTKKQDCGNEEKNSAENKSHAVTSKSSTAQ